MVGEKCGVIISLLMHRIEKFEYAGGESCVIFGEVDDCEACLDVTEEECSNDSTVQSGTCDENGYTEEMEIAGEMYLVNPDTFPGFPTCE